MLAFRTPDGKRLDVRREAAHGAGVTPRREEVVQALVARWSSGALPPTVLDDWRIHPATFIALLETLNISPAARFLDVGAGTFQTLSAPLRAWGSQVTSVDKKRFQRPEAGCVVGDAGALPFADGTFACVVSRLFLGAPISQRARRDVALDGGDHAERARAVENAVLRELARVSRDGAWHVHHVLERQLYSEPENAGVDVIWPLDPSVSTPPTPWRDHPREALRYHLSGVLLLRKRPTAPMLGA